MASAGLAVIRNALASPSGGGGRAERPDGEGMLRRWDRPLSLAALDSSPIRGAKCLAVPLRAFWFLRSRSPSQILRRVAPQDDTLCSFRVIC